VRVIEPFEITALKYAHLGNRHAGENFILADPHEFASDLDYFVWVLRRGDEVYLVDTGFAQEAATRRKRNLLRNPADALPLIGLRAEAITNVILTHLHYDHAGNLDRFPNARFHLQDRDMEYATGRCMCHTTLRAPFDVADILKMVEHVFQDRAVFHDGDTEIASGLTLHRVGGHSAGLQVARVWTRRGWVVVASDASHLYAHFQNRRCFPVLYSVAEMLEGYNTLYKLADSEEHIVPGHDPMVLELYPAVSKELNGIAVRLDIAPGKSSRVRA
jgi:glyoxylase-like metal-dependent hydrolase (beta-lactamase superfamily II)